MDKAIVATKEWIRESVMRGEGISTPHIHRTRWDPFSLCVCLSALKRNRFLFFESVLAKTLESRAYVFPKCDGKVRAYVVLGTTFFVFENVFENNFENRSLIVCER